MIRYKFPRTPHLPFSDGVTDDDQKLSNINHFIGKTVCITEKLDGENTTIYSDGFIHSRSIDSASQEWQSYIRANVFNYLTELPSGYRICGENMYAIHSIEYEKLSDFFYVFAIFDDNNVCLSIDDIKKICDNCGLSFVPQDLITEIVDERSLYSLRDTIQLKTSRFGEHKEGFVLRNINSFHYSEYGINVAKYVRSNHVQTDVHWTKTWKKANLFKEL